VLATQELLEFDDQELTHTNFDEEEKCWIDVKNIDIWKDVICMKLLNEGIVLDTTDAKKNKRTKKRIINYHWQDQKLYFKWLFVPKLEEKKTLIIQMHWSILENKRPWLKFACDTFSIIGQRMSKWS
jgi:hypothetical protein